MNLTALDIIRDAMSEIGALAKNEQPTSDEANDVLRALNGLLDSLSARRLISLAGLRQGFPLTANKEAYTIGTGGDFNVTEPISIEPGAFVRDGNGQDTPIEIVNMDLYNSYGDKEFSGGLVGTARPTTIAFDAGATQQAVQTGTIYVYPIPDGSTPYTLFLTMLMYLTEFAALNTVYTFPPAYYRMLKFNLAPEIYGSFFNESKQPIPVATVRLARESMRIIETVNARRVAANMDLPGQRVAPFNVYTGDQ
jgi:hypothetical protein